MGSEVTRRNALVGIASLAGLASLGQRASAQGVPASDQAIQAGETAPVLEVFTLDGRARRFDWPKGRITVVVFFLPSCPVCHKMIPRWNSAFERKPANLDLVGVMLEPEPPSFFQIYPMSFPVFRSSWPGPEEMTQRRAVSAGFQVKKVPVTLRIAPGGLVQDSATGLIDPIKLGELFRP